MNFTRQQARAERTGRLLLALHALATIVVVVAVDVLATLLWHLMFGAATEPPRGFHATNVGVVLAFVVGGAWLETARLREDGAIVAQRLGAVPVDAAGDPLHRRLQNLLEELAIVARIGVPRAFVLEHEPTINALTAGMDRHHAIVIVTRGALERLTRDELQGVLAHEVSHVVNGDVRLNTRLIGMNHGLQWIALFGRSLLRAASSRLRDGDLGVLGVAAAGPMALAGAVLRVVGAIGAVAAHAIQAGVGRQREYFADAQAIAFTRNQEGLGGALRKVAGQAAALRREAGAAGGPVVDPRRAAAMRHPYWHNVAHLLLVGVAPSRRWFETHPSLRERVQRIYGRAMAPVEPRVLDGPERREAQLPALHAAITAAEPGPFDEVGGAAPTSPASLPWPDASARLLQATRDSTGAAALVVALVETPGQASPAWDQGWSAAASRLPALREALAALPSHAVRSLRWPLMELSVARLRPLSRPSRETLLATVRGVVEADARITLREWIHFGLLRLRLVPPPPAPRLAGLGDPVDARCVRVLFALVAHCAHVSEAKADRAANAAIRALELAPIGGSAGPLTLDALDRAVRRAAQLPPLDRPVLVRGLAELLPADADAEVGDFLRLLCVAIDCPPPQLPSRGRASRPSQAAALADAGA